MKEKELRVKLTRLQSRAHKLSSDISSLVRELDQDKKWHKKIKTKQISL